MFGNRYWGPRHFGDRYWGDGSGVAPPTPTPEPGLPPAGGHRRRDDRRRFLLPDGTIVLARTQDEVTRLIGRTVAEAVPEAVEKTVLHPRLNRKGKPVGPAREPVPQISAEVLDAISRLQMQSDLFALADAIAVARAKTISARRSQDEDALAAILMVVAAT